MLRQKLIGMHGAVALGILLGCGGTEVDLAGSSGPSGGSTPAGGGGPGASPGASSPDFKFEPTTKTVATPDAGPSAAMNCGFKKYGLERLPAELLLVLDKSGSMNTAFGTAGTRWAAMTMVLGKVVKQTPSVMWGLKLYPSLGGNCNIGTTMDVEPSATAHGAVAMKVAGTGPDGATPTQLALRLASKFLQSRTTPNPKYLLLATDGNPNCRPGGSSQSEDVAGAVAAVEEAAKAGFPTFVVGVATTDSEAHNTLNQMATKGERPRPGAVKYHAADSAAELTMALETIAGEVASCTFTLDQTPPSPNDVAVDIDGQRVPREATNGWDYGPNMRSVVLRGSWCDRVRNGGIMDIQIIFGCPGVVIP